MDGLARKCFGAHHAILNPTNPQAKEVLGKFKPLYEGATCSIAIDAKTLSGPDYLTKLVNKLAVRPQKRREGGVEKDVIISIQTSDKSFLSLQTGNVTISAKDVPYSHLFHLQPAPPKILYECFRTSRAAQVNTKAEAAMILKAKGIEANYLQALQGRKGADIAKLMTRDCKGSYIQDNVINGGTPLVQRMTEKAPLTFPKDWFSSMRFACHFDKVRSIFIVMTTGMCCVDKDMEKPMAFTHVWTTGSDFKIKTDIFRLNIA